MKLFLVHSSKEIAYIKDKDKMAGKRLKRNILHFK